MAANPQISALRKGVDIVIARPGRLTDHVQSGHVRLDRVEITVLDEADPHGRPGLPSGRTASSTRPQAAVSGCSSRQPSTPAWT
ncbi:MAG: DEAD/DEAH box helicase [Nocardioidaceae bacterium]